MILTKLSSSFQWLLAPISGAPSPPHSGRKVPCTHAGHGEPAVADVGVAVAVRTGLDLLHLPLTHPQQRLGQRGQLATHWKHSQVSACYPLETGRSVSLLPTGITGHVSVSS